MPEWFSAAYIGNYLFAICLLKSKLICCLRSLTADHFAAAAAAAAFSLLASYYEAIATAIPATLWEPF